MSRTVVGADALYGASGHAPAAHARDTTVDRLISVTRDVQLRLADALTEWGDHGLRASFAPMLQAIRDDPLPISRIAEVLRVSPQAASRSATALEQLGYLVRTPTASDGRSRLVTLTARGRGLIEHAAEALLHLEVEYARFIGRSEVSSMVRGLDELRDGLDLYAPTGTVLPIRSRRSIGVVILVALQAKREIVRLTATSGHAGVRASHHELLTIIGSGGARVSEMARFQQVSRQATSKTVQELESLGYVGRRPDEVDHRGVVFSLTSRGGELVADTVDAIKDIETRYRNVLGDVRFDRFTEAVATLNRAISGSDRASTWTSAQMTLAAALPPAPVRRPDAAPDQLERLAHQLRDQLGTRDTARLVALLGDDGIPTRQPQGFSGTRRWTRAAR